MAGLMCGLRIGASVARRQTSQSSMSQWGATTTYVTSSRSLSASSTQPADSRGRELVFTGPLGPAMRSVKSLSLAGLASSLVAAPILVAGGSAGATVGSKVALAVALTGFSGFTTRLLHWFSGPYVLRLWHDIDSDEIDVETLTFFLQRKITRFNMTRVRGPFEGTMHPLNTFSVAPSDAEDASGTSPVFFYIDQAGRFSKATLLERLLAPSKVGEEVSSDTSEENSNNWDDDDDGWDDGRRRGKQKWKGG